MLDQQDGNAQPVADVDDQVAELAEVRMGKPGCRLVQQQQLRLADVGAREFHALALPKGESAHRDAGDRRQFEHLEQTRGPLPQQPYLAADDRQAQRVSNKHAAAARTNRKYRNSLKSLKKSALKMR
jgi:hypothetical protein